MQPAAKFPALPAAGLALGALALAWLWLVLIAELRVEWALNPQYAYGWAVPFLCVFLIFEKNRKQKTVSRNVPVLHLPNAVLIFFAALLALLYAPTRLVQEANPGWRLMDWARFCDLLFPRRRAVAERARTNAHPGFDARRCYDLGGNPWLARRASHAARQRHRSGHRHRGH